MNSALPVQPWGPGFKSPAPTQKLGVPPCAQNSSCEEQRQEHPKSSLTDQTGKKESFRFRKDSAPREEKGNQ